QKATIPAKSEPIWRARGITPVEIEDRNSGKKAGMGRSGLDDHGELCGDVFCGLEHQAGDLGMTFGIMAIDRHADADGANRLPRSIEDRAADAADIGLVFLVIEGIAALA